MQKELNLVPYYLREQQEKQRKKQEFIMRCSLLGLTLIIGAGILFLYKVSLSSKAEKLKAEIFENQKIITEKEQLSEEIEKLNQHLDKVESLKSREDPKTDDRIRKLTSLMPVDFKVKKLSYTDDVINLEILSGSMESIQEFWANLRESEEFNRSHISTISNSEGYNLACTIKMGEEDKSNEYEKR